MANDVFAWQIRYQSVGDEASVLQMDCRRNGRGRRGVGERHVTAVGAAMVSQNRLHAADQVVATLGSLSVILRACSDA